MWQTAWWMWTQEDSGQVEAPRHGLVPKGWGRVRALAWVERVSAVQLARATAVCRHPAQIDVPARVEPGGAAGSGVP